MKTIKLNVEGIIHHLGLGILIVGIATAIVATGIYVYSRAHTSHAGGLNYAYLGTLKWGILSTATVPPPPVSVPAGTSWIKVYACREDSYGYYGYPFNQYSSLSEINSVLKPNYNPNVELESTWSGSQSSKKSINSKAQTVESLKPSLSPLTSSENSQAGPGSPGNSGASGPIPVETVNFMFVLDPASKDSSNIYIVPAFDYVGGINGDSYPAYNINAPNANLLPLMSSSWWDNSVRTSSYSFPVGWPLFYNVLFSYSMKNLSSNYYDELSNYNTGSYVVNLGQYYNIGLAVNSLPLCTSTASSSRAMPAETSRSSHVAVKSTNNTSNNTTNTSTSSQSSKTTNSNTTATKLTTTQTQTCQNHFSEISTILGRVNTRTSNQINLLSSTANNVESFYAKQNRTISNYQQLTAAVSSEEATAQKGYSAMKADSNFSCSSSNPKGTIITYQGDLKAEINNLQNLKTSVTNLINAVAKVNGVNVSFLNNGDSADVGIS